MSSSRRQDTPFIRATTVAFALVAALLLVLALGSPSANAASKLPKITKVSPTSGIQVGKTLKLQGKNFVKGSQKLIVIFRRDGSKKSFTGRGTASSSTRGSVVVPDVSSDLIVLSPSATDNRFRLRAITKFGTAKEWTVTSISPKINPKPGATTGVGIGPGGLVAAVSDCDSDGSPDNVDTDDDNDHLIDSIELSIGTKVCNKDTDGDIVSDYYEYTMAYTLNGGPVLPYPGLLPFPNPIVQDTGDYDNDKMTTLQEYEAWQYTHEAEFYSDVDGDSDNDGRLDPAEDVDHDLLPNHIEFFGMDPLNWLKTDTDGDGLCDGLDDQDHDGPPTPLADADCSTPVPNNGPDAASDDPPLPPTAIGDGDPDDTKIDGDDNRYSNFYEWYNEGADPDDADAMFDECEPSIYPESPYCHEGHDWDPFPTQP